VTYYYYKFIDSEFITSDRMKISNTHLFKYLCQQSTNNKLFKAKPKQQNSRSFMNTMRYFIHIDSLKTPNPNFLKFVPEGQNVLGDKGTLDISSVQYANISPLAEDLFKI